MTNTFNVPGVEENCFFLKDMEGAKALRQRINECFEISALPSTSPEERKRLLTFVVVSFFMPAWLCYIGSIYGRDMPVLIRCMAFT